MIFSCQYYTKTHQPASLNEFSCGGVVAWGDENTHPRAKAAEQEGVQIAWLCNVMHTVFGGEHPTDIYIHSITAKRP